LRPTRIAWSFALAAALAGCRAPGPRGAGHAPVHARHLVVVTIDTLRADHVGAYGAAAAATPHLDALARAGAMAPEASCHVPLTRPSHVSIFTGRLPNQTGIRDNISPAVLPAVPLLAEVLKGAGFTTGAFVSSVVLDSSSGLNRGFDVYDDKLEDGSGAAQFLDTLQRKGDKTTAEAIAWLEKTASALPSSGRLFLWLHLYDPHDPYEPPEPYASRFRERPYDGEIAFADEMLGRLDHALARLRLREETALVVTSDHGEGLGDHGETLHGFFVYQATLRVPLLVRAPGVVPGTRLSSLVGLVDVFPTVLDLLGTPGPGGTSGRSLGPELRGGRPAEPRALYAESLVPLLHFGWSDLRVLRDGRWKLIAAPRPELYDLARDPGEGENLVTKEPARAEALRTALGRVLDAERAAARKAGPGTAAPASPELLEKLGALGYVGGGAPAETRTPGADPKDKIEEFRIANDLIREGLLRLHDGDYAKSAARFQKALARGISSFEIHFYLAKALTGLGRHAEAARHFEEATRRAPAFAEAWDGLARSLLAQGRRADARRAWEKALPLAPRNARLRADLGTLLRDLGEIEAAIQRQREAVAQAPGVASYWNALGMTLGGNGRAAEAERAFAEAMRLDGRNARYAYNLGLLLQREGRAGEARPWFEKALALDPGFTPARERLAGR
jgi:arylsulfatase A-like enzyme/Flp pilus assembly protein TadD